ncbi:hypothetical protein PF005_g13374 [Phytophthora fragariae]|uniref:Uncharacterized protein n=1 Tax=Phytophthora fragariae TaxID=53985 RepID=A0A6A3XP12_9STRA|nr:hypothetical protein PF005_g13374 [Phytophthora fragariae]
MAASFAASAVHFKKSSRPSRRPGSERRERGCAFWDLRRPTLAEAATRAAAMTAVILYRAVRGGKEDPRSGTYAGPR